MWKIVNFDEDSFGLFWKKEVEKQNELTETCRSIWIIRFEGVN